MLKEVIFMKIYKIGEFAKLIGKSTQTLRRWDWKGILKPHHISPMGIRYYTEDQYTNFMHIKNKKKRIIIGYCRVSSNKQKNDLEKQIKYVKEYLIAKGKSFKIISDIGSGINYNNKGLNEIIDLVITGKVKKIVILYKDRLIRFGFDLLKNLFEKYNVKIEIIDNTPKTEQEELVTDLIQIITVFSYKLQGKRANKAKKILKELKDD